VNLRIRAPVILLFAEINRRRNEQQGTFVATGQFLLGYLTAWTGFSLHRSQILRDL
jgi:predicted metal-binding membrane protein